MILIFHECCIIINYIKRFQLFIEMDISSFKTPETTNYSLHNNLLSSVSTPRDTHQVPSVMTKEITPSTSCTNQERTGRCWIFAALNMLRRDVIKNQKLPESFEFSQSYIFFYDKLERMNYNLNLIITLIANKHDIHSRTIQHILKEPFGDGGQWVMFTNVANKYGLVPQNAYPESKHSSNSAGINMVLSRMFRTFVNNIFKNGGDFDKQGAMQKTYEILIRFFGEPPKDISWNYKTDGKVRTFFGSPIDFLKNFCRINFNDYVSLTHDPRNDYSKIYGVENLGNVEGGDVVKYLNIDIDRLHALTKKAIDDNTPIWFGSDVGQFLNSKQGLLDKNSFDYINFLQLTDSMNKKERIDCCESLMTHAMVYVGYNLDKYGAINYWKIENSWGSDGPYKGNLICSNDWFKEYTYQLIIPKKYLNENEIRLWSGEIYRSFPLWDPMGSLACFN